MFKFSVETILHPKNSLKNILNFRTLIFYYLEFSVLSINSKLLFKNKITHFYFSFNFHNHNPLNKTLFEKPNQIKNNHYLQFENKKYNLKCKILDKFYKHTKTTTQKTTTRKTAFFDIESKN